MKVIDILNKVANKEEGKFKFRVKNNVTEWTYNYGHLYTNDLNGNDLTIKSFLYYVWDTDYELNDEIEIIEEEEIKELPPLEYIKFNFEQSVDGISNTITYMSTTATTDHDTELLALVINRLIREVEDLKHRLEVTDKELEDHKKDLLSHNGAPIILTTGLENDGLAIGKTESQKLADAFTKI